MDALLPYLDDYWRDYVADAGIRLAGMAAAYPPGAATSGARPPATLAALREQLVDEAAPRFAVLNCLTPFEVHRNPYFSAAMATAVNDWLRAEWLDGDGRLRAGMAISTLDVESAVAEIERLGADRRFVQVLLPARTDVPYGSRRYHPMYEAAARHGLAICLHAWGRPITAPTPSGFTTTYLHDYVSNAQVAQTHVLSLVSEGTFARFPDLRVVLAECGFTWLPSLLWRFDKDWKSVWREVPWVRERPSEYVRRHFRATTQPAHLPPEPGQAAEVLRMVGPGWLLHASDFPHDHGGGTEALLAALDEPDAAAVLRGNAEEVYRLGAGVAGGMTMAELMSRPPLGGGQVPPGTATRLRDEGRRESGRD
jgi:predicted TIM-barrel fold metal-dependent hydrolase